MNRDYLTMTDAEFEAYWAERRELLDRVHRRGLIYGAILLAVGVLALRFALDALAAPVWLTLPVFIALGVAVARAGIALAWRREGGKPDYLRRPLKEDQ